MSLLSLQDGFVHLSTSKQAQETAGKYFAGHTDLHLLEIDDTKFASGQLRWDEVPSRNNEKFGHYLGGKINMKQHVVDHWKLELGSDGKHQFPAMKD